MNHFNLKDMKQLYTQSLTMKPLFSLVMILSLTVSAWGAMEQITRGVVAVKDGESGNYVGWRLLGTDPDSTGFNLYRITDGGSAVKINDETLYGATNFYDSTAVMTSIHQYYVVPVVEDSELEPSDTATVWNQNFLSVPLQIPAGGTTPDNVSYTYTANDASIGDLDGDGEYEIILKWDPTNSKDNSQSGHTGNMILDAYEMDGTLLWRIDFGVNIRSGAHYTPFMVYDLNQDGKAEIAARTAPGTKDATGGYLSDGPAATADHSADYRNSSGYILTGPEYLTIFNGADGTEITTTDLEPARGRVADWGDSYGNRVDRFLAAIAYLDGQQPSLVWCRGIYEKMELAAFNWNGSQLQQIWHFKTQEGYSDWAGMGSHNLSVGDVDQDGKDEIVYGNCAIDNDGTGLWTLRNAIGKATGDAMHLADIMPEREGLEKWGLAEGSGPGTHLVDAATGEPLWLTAPGDVGRCVSGDLVAEFYGMECWGGTDGLRSANNVRVGNTPSSVNFVVWWDGDLSRELLDRNSIRKYNYAQERENVIFEMTGCASNNGSKATPCLQADLVGDWREEVIMRTEDNASLRIFTTKIPTDYRIRTLMHDHQYRLAIAWQNDSYNQPPHPGFYLGNDMFTPVEEIPPSPPTGLQLAILDTSTIRLNWNPNFETDIATYHLYKSEVSADQFELVTDTLTGTTLVDSSLVIDTEYFYYVVAQDTSGNESDPSAMVSGIPTLRPDPPALVRGTGGLNQTLIFWEPSAAENIIGYNIYVTEEPGINYIRLNAELLTDLEYNHTGLSEEHTYYYVVTAVVDDEPSESFYSEEIAVETAMKSYQSEDGNYENVWIEDNHAGHNGTGFANFDASGYVEFSYVYSPDEGWYNLVLRYALGNTSRTGIIKVNDSTLTYTMESTGEWTNWVYDTVKVFLNPGFDNTIRVEATGGDFGNLDEISIDGETTSPVGIRDLMDKTSLYFYPNPFTSVTYLDLKYEGTAVPHIRIVNLMSQVVKTSRFEKSGGGRYRFEWDGTGNGKQQLSPGIYFATIFLDNNANQTIKVVLRE